MGNMKAIGAVLIVAGLAALIVPNFSFTEDKKVIDLGPIEITAAKEHHVSIPMVAGIVAVIAGLGIVMIGAKKA